MCVELQNFDLYNHALGRLIALGIARRITVALSFITVFSASSKCQWVQTRGPYGDEVSVLGTNATDIYAAVDRSAFLSTDCGRSWTERDSGITGRISSFAFIGPTAFAASDYGMFRSTDEGKSWTGVSSIIGAREVSAVIARDTLLFAAQGASVYVSINRGAMWTPGEPLSTNGITALASKDNYLFAGTQENGIYRSAGFGSGWKEVLAPGGGGGVKAICSTGDCLFAAIWGAGVIRSTDDGESWTMVDSELTDLYVLSLGTNGSNLIAGTSSGVFLSTNDGTNWMPADSGLNNMGDGVNASSICVISKGGTGASIFVATSRGVFVSADNGQTWTATNAGLTNALVRHLAVAGEDLYAGTAVGLFHSSDSGASWAPIDSANFVFGKTNVSCVATSGADLYETISQLGSFRSTDAGNHWTEFDPYPADPGNATAFAFNGGNTFAFCHLAGGFLSSDYGAHWEALSGLKDKFVNCLEVTDGNIYAGGYGAYISTDNGATWDSVSSGLRNSYGHLPAVYCFARNESYLFAGTSTGLYSSTDGGANWVAVNSPGLTDPIICLASIGGFVFAGTAYGVFGSGNNNANWRPVGEGLPPAAAAYSFAAGKEYLYAGIGHSGVWRRPISELTGVTVSRTGQPADLVLNQNYPNPFNPTTVIKYELPVSSLVTVKVYDVLGREIRTLVDRRQMAGEYSITFDAADLPSGVYFLRLNAGEFSATRKMMLLR